MNKTFAELGLRKEILNAITLLGFSAPTTIQEKCIPPLLEGSDIIGKARTGSGKTAAFGLPIVQRINVKSRKPKALILAPTRELALQVSDAITSFCAGQAIRILSNVSVRVVLEKFMENNLIRETASERECITHYCPLFLPEKTQDLP